MKILIGLALAIFFLAGDPLTLHSQVLEQSFSDTLARFKISTPNHQWAIEPRGIDPGDSKLTIRFESPLHQFVPNVNIRMTENIDPGKLSDWFESELKRLPEGWEVLEKKPVSHRDLKGYELLVKDPKTSTLFYQRFFFAKGNLYVLTCTAKEASYPRVEGDFIKILNSFEII